MLVHLICCEWKYCFFWVWLSINGQTNFHSLQKSVNISHLCFENILHASGYLCWGRELFSLYTCAKTINFFLEQGYLPSNNHKFCYEVRLIVTAKSMLIILRNSLTQIFKCTFLVAKYLWWRYRTYHQMSF